MYYTPVNYTDMQVGMIVRDTYFNIVWEVIQNDGNKVVVQNQPPKGSKIELSKETSRLVFHE